jgi:hypothetical protein
MKKISIIAFIIYFLISLISFILLQFEIISSNLFQSIIIAELLNIFNLLLALTAFKYTVRKSNQEFLFFNLGGLVARMLGLLFAILIILKFLNIDKDGFILLFFIFYFSQLTVEIGYFGSYKKIKAE